MTPFDIQITLREHSNDNLLTNWHIITARNEVGARLCFYTCV